MIDAVVDQFAREIVLECTRERSREALHLLKQEREMSRFWDDILTGEIVATASAVIDECKAEQAALAKKAQPQVSFAAPSCSCVCSQEHAACGTGPLSSLRFFARPHFACCRPRLFAY